jgi:hypothetical protein
MRRICTDGPCRAAGDLSLNGASGIADGAAPAPAPARGAVLAVAVERNGSAVWCLQRVSLVVSGRLIITGNLALWCRSLSLHTFILVQVCVSVIVAVVVWASEPRPTARVVIHAHRSNMCQVSQVPTCEEQ